MKGLGLLPNETIFMPEKTRTRVNGVFTQVEGILAELSGLEFEGYEIHMGITTSSVPSCIQLQSDTMETVSKEDGSCRGNVYGT